jgi:hypothetical protein
VVSVARPIPEVPPAKTATYGVAVSGCDAAFRVSREDRMVLREIMLESFGFGGCWSLWALRVHFLVELNFWLGRWTPEEAQRGHEMILIPFWWILRRRRVVVAQSGLLDLHLVMDR